MRNDLEKYDKLVTAILVIAAFVLAIGWWFAREKSEPVYLSKIDKLMFDKDNKAPKFVLTLPDKLTTKTKNKNDEVVVDVANTPAIKHPAAEGEDFSLDKLLANVPNVFNLPVQKPTLSLDNVDFDETVVEVTNKGKKLPKISAEGKKPWSAYGITAETQPNFKKVALVISGLGFDTGAADKIAVAFDSGTSLSISPYAVKPRETLIKARENGHETYADTLLSSKDFLKEDSGPLSLTADLSAEEALERFRQTISLPAPIGGIVIRDGLINAGSIAVLTSVLREAGNRGLLVVDATSEDLLSKIKIEGLAHRKADLVIDRDMTKDEIEKILKKAENIAFDKGQVLVVTDAKPVIITALYDWIKTFSPQVSYEDAKTVDITKPFALVPLSNLVVE